MRKILPVGYDKFFKYLREPKKGKLQCLGSSRVTQDLMHGKGVSKSILNQENRSYLGIWSNKK